MTKQVPFTTALPLSTEQLGRLRAATSDFSSLQLAWISGYFWGCVAAKDQTVWADSKAQPQSAATTAAITLLSASQTGNARRLAEQLRDDLIAAQLDVVLMNAGDYKFKQIAQEKLLIVVTSTHGDGDPPEEAVALYKYLFSKKAPALPNTKFAVFGLGDSSYDQFAKIGKDFDTRLEELGAQRLYDRVDADVDYQVQAEAWRTEMVNRLKSITARVSSEQQPSISGNYNKELNSNSYTKDTPLNAYLSVRHKITSRQSRKDVRHLEIDLGNSKLHYQPGDALGVWYENDSALISELLALLQLKANEQVTVSGQKLSLSKALQKYYELTQNNPAIVEHYAFLAQDKTLCTIVADKSKLQRFTQTTPIVDMVRRAPIKICSEQLLGLLRPLTPRLYSIASSQAEVGAEVHITVGVVRYEIDGRPRTGGASSYLADRLPEGGILRVFIEPNDNFRLPNNPTKPVIMIGPGTGIAPFRAFLQQREAEGASGENWLFFGNPHFTDDFLYQVEWQRYTKIGLLTKIDLAWSRDQAEKIYVQDKIREQGADVWRWIKHGAHIYVCGDANRMASDVEQALVAVVAEHGGMDLEQADEFLSELRLERRYQRDVY